MNKQKAQLAGIRIEDMKIAQNGGQFLRFDLRHILMAIGEPVAISQWICRDLWYTAKRDGELFEFEEARRKLSGEEMIQFAESIHQTISGRFEARSGGTAKRLWLVVLAVDSSWFEVWSSKHDVLERVKASFERTRDLPAPV